MRKIVLSIFTILMLCFSLSAQNQRVSGTVTDESRQPLIGVSVILKGTHTAAVTGVDGQYSLNVPADGVLVFSSLGYTTQEISVANKTVINVVLVTDVKDAGEVVVIGYGTGQKLGTVTGDVSTVSADIVKDKPTANVADAMQGQVSGLSIMTSSGEPGQVSSIMLHGVGSLNASSTPLIVVDGVPSASGVLQRLGNNDIENITVLKDASATSIYGSRAANGVIYITTKKGRKDLPASIRLSANYSISTPARNGRLMMDGGELLDWELEFNELTIDEYLAFKERYDEDGNFDWFKFTFPTKYNYNVDFSVQGGSEFTNYYVSGGYRNEQGLAPGSWLEVYTFRLSLDTDIRPWLKYGTNIGISYDVNSRARTAFQSEGADPSAPGFFAMLMPGYRYPTDTDGNELTELIPGTVPIYNPYVDARLRPGSSDNVYINGSTYLNINPLKGLNIRSVFGVEFIDFTSKSYTDPRWLWAAGTGARSRSFDRQNTFNVTNTIEYKFSLNENVHNFTILAGQEGLAYSNQYFLAQSIGQNDFRNMLISNGAEATINNVDEEFREYNYLSAFGRLNYNYKEKYSAEFTFRNDASSKFGRDVRNAQFWAAGLLWNVKKEDFLADNRAITALTFRATYGTQGNSSMPDVRSPTGMIIYGENLHLGLVGTSRYQNAVSWILAWAGNPRLTWEKQDLFNAGFELGLLNKLNVALSYYYRNTHDMLQDIPVSATTGFTSSWRNAGSMLNTGVDIDLTYNIFQNKDWNINLSTVFGYNHNELTELYQGVEEIPFPGGLMTDKVGEPTGMYYAPVSVGVDPRDGYEMYLDENGNPTKDVARSAYHVTGKSRWAPYQGGFNFNATWKGLSLLTQFSWRVGSHIASNEAFFLEGPAFKINGRPDYMHNIWRNPGDVTDIPGYHAPLELSSRHISSTSFLRLKSLTLSYDFPKNLIDKTGFLQGARVFFIGRNLFTISPYDGYDPEPYQYQFALGEYPMSRQYSFGIELTF